MAFGSELVSIVIPTRFRPDLLLRAVQSALAQTHSALEVIVIVDGPDPATVERLAAVTDPRLVVLTLPKNAGAADARNVGVQKAKGDWIAFLDDDDEWMPAKIERQMATRPAGLRYPIMSCMCEVATARGTFLWPRRPATTKDAIGDYLFVRRGLFKGETFAPTTTLLAPRELLLLVPFPKSLCDDWEWLLDCGRIDGCALVTVPEALAVHYTENNRTTLSTCQDIGAALAWADSQRHKMSAEAYASLLMQVIGGDRLARPAGVRWRILSSAVRRGRPTGFALSTFLLHSLTPVHLRRRLRQALTATPAAS